MRRAAVLFAITACGGEAAPPPAPVTTIAGDLTDPGAGAADAIVARIDGRPIWASCILGHVRARRVTVDHALADCIDLELLAAEAVRRGLGDDGDVRAALRTALVDGFVGKEFEDRHRTHRDVPPEVAARYVASRRAELDRPEVRVMVYVRAPVPPGTPAGAPDDLAARALADEIYAEVGERDDLFAADLAVIARRIAHGRPLEAAVPRPGGLQEDFGRAAYAVPAIGRVSPPTRTPWGWDIILIVDIEPARHQTPEQLLATAYQPLLRAYFTDDWGREIAARFTVETFADRLAATAAPAGDPSGSAEP